MKLYSLLRTQSSTLTRSFETLWLLSGDVHSRTLKPQLNNCTFPTKPTTLSWVARHLLRKKAKPCLIKSQTGWKKAKLLNKHEIWNYSLLVGHFRRIKLQHYLYTLQEHSKSFQSSPSKSSSSTFSTVFTLESLVLRVARCATTLFFYRFPENVWENTPRTV